MSEESERADQCPRPVDAALGRGGRTGGETVSLGGIDVEQANDGVIEAVEDGESGREVIKLLGNGEIYIPDVALQFLRSPEPRKGPTSRVEH